MADKKPPQQRKPSLSPEAAKLLEQYRNAGKSKNGDGASPDSADQSGAKPSTSAHAPTIHRSGTRGK